MDMIDPMAQELRELMGLPDDEPTWERLFEEGLCEFNVYGMIALTDKGIRYARPWTVYPK